MQLSELFGTSAAISGDTLTIDLAELAATHSFDSAIASITPGQIFSLIIQQAALSTSDKTADPSYGVTVDRSFDSIVERGTDSHIGYGYTCTLYAQNTAATLDPDNVV